MPETPRYKPLPPIASPAPSDPGDPSGASLQDPRLPPTLDASLPALRRRIRRLASSPNLPPATARPDAAFLLEAAEKWAKPPGSPSSVEFGERMVEFRFVMMFKKVWRANFEAEFGVDGRGDSTARGLADVTPKARDQGVEERGDITPRERGNSTDRLRGEARDAMRQLQTVMLLLTKSCVDICRQVVQTELQRDLFGYLRVAAAQPSALSDQVKADLVLKVLFTLQDVVQNDLDACVAYRACDALSALQPYRASTNPFVSTAALMIQAFVATDAQSETLNSGAETFQFLVSQLDDVIRRGANSPRKPSSARNSKRAARAASAGVSARPLLTLINKLAANDANKGRIVQAGALPHYAELLRSRYGTVCQREAASGLWILAFRCRADIVKDAACMRGLRGLLKQKDEGLRKVAEGALWTLDENNSTERGVRATLHKRSSSQGLANNKGHVFISYQWGSKATVLTLVERLKAVGVKVWVDTDDMAGSVMDSMAYAVEHASVVVVCVSEKYRDSPNCRSEGEYAFRLAKRIIPLRLQAGYRPDGWLGLLVGSQLVIDFSQSDRVDESTETLIRALKTNPADGNDKVKPDINSAQPGVDPPQAPAQNTPLQAPPQAQAQPLLTWVPDEAPGSPLNIQSWSKAKVHEWVKRSKLSHLHDWFEGLNGALLLEYSAMSVSAPDAFYSHIFKHDLSLADALAISTALKQLG